MNVIGYIRVSTHGQVKDGYSLSYQQDEIREYCQKEGWNLLEIFSDEGISGAKVDEKAMEVDREGFQDMLSIIQSQPINLVIVLNTSRLWRSDIVKVLIHREFKKHNVDIRSIEQSSYSIHKKDPNDFLINGLMELLDQYQRLEIAMKLGKGKKKKAQQGEYVGGKVTYGYAVHKGKDVMQVQPHEAKVVRSVFQFKRDNSKWSLSDIAHALNNEGYRTREGQGFTKVQVKRILDRKDIYQGKFIHGSVTVLGKHSTLIASSK
jgi:site-specific DNA recombinase